MTNDGNEIETFRAIYEKHVAGVAAGDTAAVLADMVQAGLPTVFEGVEIPRGSIEAYEIVAVTVADDRMVGETVYRTAAGVVGLRSIWERHDDRWLAAELANFPVRESGTPGEVSR